MLNEVERQTASYGSASFGKSLIETYRRLAEHVFTDEDLAQVQGFAQQVASHPIEVMEGVRETLDYLSPRHQLILLTKGDVEEQKFKIENSGLADYFEQVVIVAEKDLAVYQQVVQEFQFASALTWMIGNAPRSDINPALKAGLNAVYIPHSHTWGLEMQEVERAGNGQLLQLRTFAELRNYF